jgi:thiol-disulfide isomerase/thioredoxin
MRIILTYYFLIIVFFGLGQNQTTINCYAPQFKGQIAQLVTYEDYISYETKVLDKGIVDEKGNISFQCDAASGYKAMIQIQDKSATIYIDPSTPKYTVSFPYRHENVQKLTGNTVRLVFDSLPDNDLNTLILEFNLRLDYFLYGDTLKVQRVMLQNDEFRDSLSVFTQSIFKEYKDVDSRYFKDYYKYSIASVALFSNRQEPDKNKFIVFETFIKAKPILDHNDAYMYFIQDFYEDVLSDISMVNRDKATFAINNVASREKLDLAMSQHYYLANKEFREFIMLNALQEAYHSTYFSHDNIRFILDLVANNSEFPSHSDIAKNILRVQEKLAPGTPAPEFSWIEPSGDTNSLKSLRGKYVYIMFWASWNKPSIQEMMVIQQLQEKYNKYVDFVCISLDYSEEDYLKFVKANYENYNWHFGHYKGDAQLLDDYSIRNVPYYILVDMQGNIEQSPAYSPSPNGSYRSIDETFHYIKTRLEPKQDFKVGQR